MCICNLFVQDSGNGAETDKQIRKLCFSGKFSKSTVIRMWLDGDDMESPYAATKESRHGLRRAHHIVFNSWFSFY